MTCYSLLLLLTALGGEIISGQNTNTLRLEDALPNLEKEVEDNRRYKTLEANATVMKLLVDNKDGVSKSEVFDMLHSKDDNEDHMDLPTFPEDLEDARADVPAPPDSQAEFLQAPGEKVEKDSESLRLTAKRREPMGAAAGIMVAITASIVCIAYTALIVWRRIYLACGDVRETMEHILCECDVLATKRMSLLGNAYPKPEEYRFLPLSEITALIDHFFREKRNGLKHELLRNEEIAETRIEL